ncbi:MAG: hypothetical protein QXO71_06870 [Candidatus Jordarchaeaceae archaeon]
MLLRDSKKVMDFFFDVFTNSMKSTQIDNYSRFQIPSRCFELMLGIVESYFGENIKLAIVDNFQKSLKSMFKNIILGRGAGKYIKIKSKDELIRWLTSFKEEFSKFGLVCPTIEEIKTEVRRYIEEEIQDPDKAEQIRRHVAFLLEDDINR